MTYQETFKKAIEAVAPANQLLSTESFVNACCDILSGESMTYTPGATPRLTVPHAGPGLYMFWANFTHWESQTRDWSTLLNEFLDEWDGPSDAISYVPKSNRSRAGHTLGRYQPGDLVPFYLGKSENVAKRIQQHLYLPIGKRTYALKLEERAQLLAHATFEITHLPFDVDKEHYFLVQRVESILRDSLMPIIGRQ